MAASLLLSTPVFTSPAAADPAQRVFEQGRALFLEGFWSLAVKRLSEAKALAQDPRLLGQIHLYLGLSYEGDGLLDRSRKEFEQALTFDPTLALSQEQFKPAVAALFSEVKAGLRGELHILQQGAGTRTPRVLVDGRETTRMPHLERIVIGVHRIEVRGPAGEIILVKQGIVFPGRRTVLEVPALTAPSPGPPAPARPARPRRLWTWIVGGAAAASAGFATAFGWVARSRQQEGEDLIRGGLEDQELQRFDELHSEVDRYTLAANLAWATAGALAVTSVVLFFIEGKPASLRAPSAAPQGGEARAGWSSPRVLGGTLCFRF